MNGDVCVIKGDAEKILELSVFIAVDDVSKQPPPFISTTYLKRTEVGRNYFGVLHVVTNPRDGSRMAIYLLR